MEKMKAAVCTRYGPPEVLQIQEVNKPVCKDNDILVRIMASSVNSGDVNIRGLNVKGFPRFVMQLILGFFKPRNAVLGIVYAGVVEATGKNTNRFNVGDRVFGMTGFRFGAYAEYVCVKPNSTISTMPGEAGFEEAAALPFGWHTAIYFLEKAGIKELNRPNILIYGATGSVGVAAVQFAQYFDSELTVVCSGAGKDVMDELHVKNLINYELQDFRKVSQKFDIVFDAAGKITKPMCKHLLTPNGKFATVGGLHMARQEGRHLEIMKQLFEQGKCKAVIDKQYPFGEIVAANRYVDTGRKKGDVVISIH